MKKARDIREQLTGLCERVEIEPEASGDTNAIRKAITAGFFSNCARVSGLCLRQVGVTVTDDRRYVDGLSAPWLT
jgi:hypothetical protein